MNARMLFVGLGLSFLLASCSSGSNGCPGAGDGRGRGDFEVGDRDLELETRSDSESYVSRGFRYNPAVCSANGAPASAAVTGVEATVELLDQFAALLEEEGFKVYRGPEPEPEPEPAEPGSDVPGPADAGIPFEVMEEPDVVSTEVEVPDEITEPGGWQGGQYVVALTPSGDVLFAAENGILGVASWCPAENLGQVRRLDYGLADAVILWSSLVGWDYVAETKNWVFPDAIYTQAAGGYHRTYMNQSLSLPETHAGQLSVSGLPEMAGFGLFGHADAPSPQGDQVGVELLQVGLTVLVESYTEIVHEQATLVWDATPHVGEGDNPVTVDLMLASEKWESLETGFYTFFADAVFPANLNGSLVLSLQGAPPGKLLVSKDIDELEMPPIDGL